MIISDYLHSVILPGAEPDGTGIERKRAGSNPMRADTFFPYNG